MKDKEMVLARELGGALQYDEPMASHTTMGVGGAAQYYFEAANLDDLILAVVTAQKHEIPYRVVGNGSNILFSDHGFKGLIVVNRTGNIALDLETRQVVCDSGVPLTRLVTFAAEHSLGGLEPLYGIPATVGGAVYGNAGAHGADVAQFLRFVTILAGDGKIVKRRVDWLKMGYRTSRLKQAAPTVSPAVVLVASFQFQPRKIEDIQDDIAQFRTWRAEHQPLRERTSGSIFRNPSGSSAGDKTVSAGYLLEAVGAKKLKVGGAAVTAQHANWIRNTGNAQASDVRRLIEMLKEKVAQEKDIHLQEEIEYLGSWH